MQDMIFKKTCSIVLLGGGDFSITLAKWCKENGITVRVITSSRHFSEELRAGGTLGEHLKSNMIEYMKCDSLIVDEINKFKEDLDNPIYLSLGAAWIFKNKHIEGIFEGRLLNFHSTRLPRDKGGGAHSWQILRGNRFGNSQIHLIDEGIDSGDLLWGHEFLFPPQCRTPKDYFEYEESQKYELLTSILLKLKEGDVGVTRRVQSTCFSTYWPRLNSAKHSWIDWSYSADILSKFISAFDDPYCGAQTLLNGEKKVFLKKAMPVYEDGFFHPYQSGIVYRNNQRWLCIATCEGSLIIEEVFDEAGVMILDKINDGDRFYTPSDKFDDIAERVIYTSKGLK